MRVVILGAGVVGFQIAEQLISEGKDVVIIEKNEERAKYLSGRLDCIVINDEGTNISSLKKSGMSEASIFISATNSDEVNMIACGLATSEFHVPLKIARVRNIDYSKSKTWASHSSESISSSIPKLKPHARLQTPSPSVPTAMCCFSKIPICRCVTSWLTAVLILQIKP